jgi:hypothetical protein
MDLMINPSVGLTVVTSSFMILLTIVVLPALSKPLGSGLCKRHCHDLRGTGLQHQYSHLFVFQSRLSQD